MKKLKLFSLLSAASMVMGLTIFLSSCQKDDFEDGINQEIAKSPEMEEYIIAASVFNESLNIFNEEIKKVDFSKLEIVTDQDGRKVIHLSEAIRSLYLEQKAGIMNEKKEALLKKYPQLVSENLDTKYKYINFCVKKSVKVNDNFLERGIIINLPLTKGGLSETFSGYDSMMSYIAQWMYNPNYVEAYIVVYSGGSTEVYIDSSNTPSYSTISIYPTSNPNVYTRNGQNILYVAHTHQYSSTPGGTDLSMKAKYPGLNQAIYYNGSMTFFNLNGQ